MPLQHRDYYKILQVAPRCQPEDIHKKYRELAKQLHPDRNPDKKAWAQEKMKELVAAYTILKDEQKRKEYDAQPMFQPRRHKVGGRPEDKKKKAAADKAKKGAGKTVFGVNVDGLMALFGGKKAGPLGPQYDPKASDMHFTLGLSMSDNPSFYEQARDEFKLATKFDDKNKEATYNLGLMLYKLGEFDEAISCFQRVLGLDKADPHAPVMIRMLLDEGM